MIEEIHSAHNSLHTFSFIMVRRIQRRRIGAAQRERGRRVHRGRRWRSAPRGLKRTPPLAPRAPLQRKLAAARATDCFCAGAALALTYPSLLSLTL